MILSFPLSGPKAKPTIHTKHLYKEYNSQTYHSKKKRANKKSDPFIKSLSFVNYKRNIFKRSTDTCIKIYCNRIEMYIYDVTSALMSDCVEGNHHHNLPT